MTLLFILLVASDGPQFLVECLVCFDGVSDVITQFALLTLELVNQLFDCF